MQKQTPDPWAMNPRVTEWLAENIDPATPTVELGGGSGSMLLHESFTNCITVEHDPGFARMLRTARIPVLEVELRNGWYDVSGDLPEHLGAAGLVVVDGPSGWRRENIKWHTDEIRPGAVVVFDDSQRSQLSKFCSMLHTVQGWELLEVIQDGHRTAHILRKP
jgi:tRNA A58 N-methylase Trm61